MLKNLRYACALALAASMPCAAQGHPRNYYELAAGVIAEQSEFAVRSSTGGTVAFTLGRRIRDHVALEAASSAAAFAAPKAFISPGGCLGAQPCILPSASKVVVTTLSGGAAYSLFRNPNTPFLAIGVGVRLLTEHPERASDTRPFAEVAGGAAYRRWTIRVRYQAARQGAELPTWMVPITLGYRF